MAPNAAAPAAAAAQTPSAGKIRRAQRARPLDASGVTGPSDPTAFGPNPETWRAWTCDEVCSWVTETLRREGIPDAAAIVAAFRSQAVTGAHLDMLSPALLREELAFGALGPRLSFLRARDALIAPGGSEAAGGSPATGSENGELKALRHSVYELDLRVQRLEAASEVANSPSSPDSALSGEREGTDCLSKDIEDTVEDRHAPLKASDCLKKGIKDTVGTGIKGKHGTAQDQETNERHKPPRSEEGGGGEGRRGRGAGVDSVGHILLPFRCRTRAWWRISSTCSSRCWLQRLGCAPAGSPRASYTYRWPLCGARTAQQRRGRGRRCVRVLRHWRRCSRRVL